ncbi:MAG: adenine deaminase, partial [Deltaproteobacteria bacterium]|nr:adenine deaminase [Deltaproteobacteria bacterium]
ADLYLSNGRVVNVFTGEVLTHSGVAVWEESIAYVGSNTDMIGNDTEVLDCNESYILPGYIDAHCHTDYLNTPRAFAEHVLPMGTTTLLSELTMAEVLGSKGIDHTLGATEDLPLKFFLSLPSTVPPFPEIEGVDYVPLSEMKKYADHPRILALGEITSWPRITSLDPSILEKMRFALDHGLLIEGHLTGCKHHEINALASAGITSCHESITAQEAKEKLGLGLYLITDNPHLNTSRIMLTLDVMNPEDLVRYGHANYLIKSATELGIDPIKAVQMVTINPATYLGLDRILGSIAPGRIADILIVDKLEEGVPKMVIANGQIVARSGNLCKGVMLPQSSNAVLLPDYWPEKRFSPSDFKISAPNTASTSVNFPVIKVINKTITKRMDKEVQIKSGEIKAIPEEGILKISIIGRENNVTSGLLRGFGGDIGGLGTSIGVFNNIISLGNNDQDMAIATNRMLDVNGGIVLVKGGKIISEVPLPIAGIQSTHDVKTLARQIETMKSDLKAFGCNLDDPMFTIHFLCMPGLPFIRILPQGILDIVSQKFLFPSNE